MLNNIGYLAYILTMGIFLLITPSSFIKKWDQEQEQSSINILLQKLLQTETGLRICGFYHLILLVVQIFKQEQVKFICLNVYALFLISIITNLYIDGVGQIQSEKLERLGYQTGIFSFIAYNNWPQKKKDLKIEDEKNVVQTIQNVDYIKEKEKSNENIQKDQKQGKKKGKAKNE